MCTYIITRHTEDNPWSRHKDINDRAREIMTSDWFNEYTEKYGFHFTDKLSVIASHMLTNASGSDHHWEPGEVSEALSKLGLRLNKNITLGDITYLANYVYSMVYPELVSVETTCIKLAVTMANSTNNYEGYIFQDWVSSVINKEVNIDELSSWIINQLS
jgi:hypothetical protein